MSVEQEAQTERTGLTDSQIRHVQLAQFHLLSIGIRWPGKVVGNTSQCRHGRLKGVYQEVNRYARVIYSESQSVIRSLCLLTKTSPEKKKSAEHVSGDHVIQPEKKCPVGCILSLILLNQKSTKR